MGDKPDEVKQYIDLNKPEHAYLFGYLWADGHIDKKQHSISASSKEPDIINELHKTFTGNKSYRQRIQKETGAVKDVYEWRLSRVLFSRDVQSKNFRKNTDCIPERSIPAFLLGFLDGDGCIYSNKSLFQVTFTSKESEDWNWFIEATQKIKSPIFKISKRSSWCRSLGKRTHSSIARLTSSNALKFLDILYNNYNGICLTRKKEKYLSRKKTVDKERTSS
jgi:hypothetical protein